MYQFAIAGSGCSSHSSYPLTWQPIPETAQRTCEQVVGTYRDRGQVEKTVSHRQSLTELLLRQNGRTWRAESMTLSFPPVGQIQIGISAPEGQSSSTPAAEWDCDPRHSAAKRIGSMVSRHSPKRHAERTC